MIKNVKEEVKHAHGLEEKKLEIEEEEKEPPM